MINSIFVQMKTMTFSFIKRSYKSTASILFQQLFPAALFLILLLMFGTSSWDSYANMRVAIVNQDQGEYAQLLIEDLEALNSVEWSYISESEATDYVISNKGHAVLQIPSDYSSVIMTGGMPDIKIQGLNNADTAKGLAVVLEHEIAALRQLAVESDDFGDSYSLFRSNRTPIKGVSVAPKEQVSGYLSFGFLLLFLFSRAYASVRLLLEDRENGTYDRIRTTPVNGIIYMGSCMLSGFITMLAQILLALGAAVLIFGYTMPGGFLPVILLLGAYNAAVLGLCLLVMTLVPTLEMANTMSSLLITPLCMLGGCYWNIDMVPEFMQKIGWFIPQFWTMKGINQLINGGGFSDISISLLVLAGFAVLFLVLNSILMNRTNRITRGIA